MQMKVYIVRHGETDSNRLNKIMGQRIDEPLNVNGILQVNRLARQLEGKYDAIFSSPLLRARQTAEILALTAKAPVAIRTEIAERDFGSMSGKSWSDVTLDDQRKAGLQGAETEEAVARRLMLFIECLREHYRSTDRILVVSHGGIVRMAELLFHCFSIDSVPNASIHEYDVSQGNPGLAAELGS